MWALRIARSISSGRDTFATPTDRCGRVLGAVGWGLVGLGGILDGLSGAQSDTDEQPRTTTVDVKCFATWSWLRSDTYHPLGTHSVW